MTGIYSSPVQYPTQPENAMRARDGLRPLCWNRPDFPLTFRVNAYRAPVSSEYVLQFQGDVENVMSSDCKSWAVRAPDKNNPADKGEDPGVESIPARECWRCWGCRHLPSDARVVITAAAAELP